ncbi:hypothetical protein EQM14_15425 [Caproiciproducens sp. NJN-50]|uniref:BclA C-terminal domain-containing protein n=1 Tax=Acutalibacteraceae TaxID=3082771 RepID=UPI000FFE315F|nr:MULTISPECIES: hypothetical protein [Acutalibacteraceae]QAT51046.1 hypothetical protein EQM14_15425 [Caproiciproducens sp. NJN-50]
MSCFSYNDLNPCHRVIPAFVPIQPCCPCCPPDPCPPCPCPCPPTPPVCDPRVPSYAFYYTTASQAVAAGNGVVFGAGSSTPDIVLSNGALLFSKPGIYLIQYQISLTAPVAGTTISLSLNGFQVAGSTVVTTTDTGYSGQAIVSVPAGGIVSLTVSAASTVSFASITAVRISC